MLQKLLLPRDRVTQWAQCWFIVSDTYFSKRRHSTSELVQQSQYDCIKVWSNQNKPRSFQDLPGPLLSRRSDKMSVTQRRQRRRNKTKWEHQKWINALSPYSFFALSSSNDFHSIMLCGSWEKSCAFCRTTIKTVMGIREVYFWWFYAL